MINVDLHGLEKTMDDYIRKNGIESTIMHIIFPFLERIGILWQTNHINPAQEHFVTNIIRQKIIVGIDKLQPTEVLSKTILLFL
ncbi:B12-binding domain-containing protein, partial [Acinetobacter baumannii]